MPLFGSTRKDSSSSKSHKRSEKSPKHTSLTESAIKAVAKEEGWEDADTLVGQQSRETSQKSKQKTKPRSRSNSRDRKKKGSPPRHRSDNFPQAGSFDNGGQAHYTTVRYNQAEDPRDPRYSTQRNVAPYPETQFPGQFPNEFAPNAFNSNNHPWPVNQYGYQPSQPEERAPSHHFRPPSTRPNPVPDTGYGAAAEYYSASFQGAPPSRPGFSSSQTWPSQSTPQTTAGSIYSSSQPQNHPYHTTSTVPASTATESYTAYPQSAPAPTASSLYQRRRGPFDKILDMIQSKEDIRKMEEYTEYIGVCKYCFDPRSSPSDAPRPHHFRRRRSRDSLRSSGSVRSSVRQRHRSYGIDKDSRYHSSPSPEGSARRPNRSSWLGAGIAGYSIAKLGSALWRSKHDFDGTSSVQPGYLDKPPTYVSRASDTSRGVVREHSPNIHSSNRSPQHRSRHTMAGEKRLPGSPRKSPQKKSGFFNFSNASSSSSGSERAFSARRTQGSRNTGKKRSSSRSQLQKTLLGISATAAALTAAQSGQRSHLVSHRPRNVQTFTKGRPQRPKDNEDDAWESASESDFSVESALAFGDAHRDTTSVRERRSDESLRSNASGTDKWDWGWRSSADKTGALTTQPTQTAALSESMHTYSVPSLEKLATGEQHGTPVSSSIRGESMKHVDPIPIQDHRLPLVRGPGQSFEINSGKDSASNYASQKQTGSAAMAAVYGAAIGAGAALIEQEHDNGSRRSLRDKFEDDTPPVSQTEFVSRNLQNSAHTTAQRGSYTHDHSSSSGSEAEDGKDHKFELMRREMKLNALIAAKRLELAKRKAKDGSPPKEEAYSGSHVVYDPTTGHHVRVMTPSRPFTLNERSEDPSGEQRRYYDDQQDSGSEAARIVADMTERYTSPQLSQAEFFSPRELHNEVETDSTQREAEIKYGKPNADVQLLYTMNAEESRLSESGVQFLRTNVVPVLGLITPTPVPSRSGSIPAQKSSLTRSSSVGATDTTRPSTTRTRSAKTANRVSWGPDDTRIFERESPHVSPDVRKDDHAREADTSTSNVASPEDDDRIPPYNWAHLPEFSANFTSAFQDTTGEGIEEPGKFNSEPVEQSFYAHRSPYVETLSDLGITLDSPGTEGAPPVQGYVIGEVEDLTPGAGGIRNVPGAFEPEYFSGEFTDADTGKDESVGPRASPDHSKFERQLKTSSPQSEVVPQHSYWDIDASTHKEEKRRSLNEAAAAALVGGIAGFAAKEMYESVGSFKTEKDDISKRTKPRQRASSLTGGRVTTHMSKKDYRVVESDEEEHSQRRKGKRSSEIDEVRSSISATSKGSSRPKSGRDSVSSSKSAKGGFFGLFRRTSDPKPPRKSTEEKKHHHRRGTGDSSATSSSRRSRDGRTQERRRNSSPNEKLLEAQRSSSSDGQITSHEIEAQRMADDETDSFLARRVETEELQSLSADISSPPTLAPGSDAADVFTSEAGPATANLAQGEVASPEVTNDIPEATLADFTNPPVETPSKAAHSNRASSSTAVPIRFRKPPQSPSMSGSPLNTHQRTTSLDSSTSMSPESTSAPHSRLSKTTRQWSNEARREFQPLYLVEHNRKPSETIVEEEYFPPLPPSRGSSRASSVNRDADGYESAVEDQSGETIKPPLVEDPTDCQEELDMDAGRPAANVSSPDRSRRHSKTKPEFYSWEDMLEEEQLRAEGATNGTEDQNASSKEESTGNVLDTINHPEQGYQPAPHFATPLETSETEFILKPSKKDKKKKGKALKLGTAIVSPDDGLARPSIEQEAAWRERDTQDAIDSLLTDLPAVSAQSNKKKKKGKANVSSAWDQTLGLINTAKTTDERESSADLQQSHDALVRAETAITEYEQGEENVTRSSPKPEENIPEVLNDTPVSNEIEEPVQSMAENEWAAPLLKRNPKKGKKNKRSKFEFWSEETPEPSGVQDAIGEQEGRPVLERGDTNPSEEVPLAPTPPVEDIEVQPPTVDEDLPGSPKDGQQLHEPALEDTAATETAPVNDAVIAPEDAGAKLKSSKAEKRKAKKKGKKIDIWADEPLEPEPQAQPPTSSDRSEEPLLRSDSQPAEKQHEALDQIDDIDRSTTSSDVVKSTGEDDKFNSPKGEGEPLEQPDSAFPQTDELVAETIAGHDQASASKVDEQGFHEEAPKDVAQEVEQSTPTPAPDAEDEWPTFTMKKSKKEKRKAKKATELLQSNTSLNTESLPPIVQEEADEKPPLENSPGTLEPQPDVEATEVRNPLVVQEIPEEFAWATTKKSKKDKKKAKKAAKDALWTDDVASEQHETPSPTLGEATPNLREMRDVDGQLSEAGGDGPPIAGNAEAEAHVVHASPPAQDLPALDTTLADIESSDNLEPHGVTTEVNPAVPQSLLNADHHVVETPLGDYTIDPLLETNTETPDEYWARMTKKKKKKGKKSTRESDSTTPVEKPETSGTASFNQALEIQVPSHEASVELEPEPADEIEKSTSVADDDPPMQRKLSKKEKRKAKKNAVFSFDEPTLSEEEPAATVSQIEDSEVKGEVNDIGEITPGQDIDFAATVAAGLDRSGFDSSVILKEPDFHQRSSPLVSTGEADPEEVSPGQSPSRVASPYMAEQLRQASDTATGDHDGIDLHQAPSIPDNGHSSSRDDFDAVLAATLSGAGFSAALLGESHDNPQTKEDQTEMCETGMQRADEKEMQSSVSGPIEAGEDEWALPVKKKGKKGKSKGAVSAAQDTEQASKANDDVVAPQSTTKKGKKKNKKGIKLDWFAEEEAEPVEPSRPAASSSTDNVESAQAQQEASQAKDIDPGGSSEGGKSMSQQWSFDALDRGDVVNDSQSEVEKGLEGVRKGQPSPVDSTTKDRTSYLFQTPPTAVNEVERPSALSDNEEVALPLEYQPMQSPGRKRSKANSDIGTPEHGIKSSRLSETPKQSVERRSCSPVDDVWHEQVDPRFNGQFKTLGSPTAMSSTSNKSPTQHGTPTITASIISNESTSPSLRRTDRSLSGDLRSHASRGQASTSAVSTNIPPFRPPPTPPLNEDDEGGTPMASTVFEGYGDGEPLAVSPTRAQSVHRKQSSHILDLEARIQALVSENERLHAANEAPRNEDNEAVRKVLEDSALQLREKEAELNDLRAMLDPVRQQVSKLTEMNTTLSEANENLVADTNDRYATLQEENQYAHEQWQHSVRELDKLRLEHSHLSNGMESLVREHIEAALAAKDAEISNLRTELSIATTRIKDLQAQILASTAEDFLVVHNEDHFDAACQKLCQHIQAWVLRFSKSSDNRICRLTADLKDEKLETRLDNCMLDGSDVDHLLRDRVRRRDIFVALTMGLIWEYVFTRYLFGMDREQRQKLKSLEKTLIEVGPPRAVAQWRATTLTLLTRRPAFDTQLNLDHEAVTHEIYNTLAALLPPPRNDEAKLQTSLKRVIRVAIDLSIDMRIQRADYFMLPPPIPEYDNNGDVAAQTRFDANTMNERSGDFPSSTDLHSQGAAVKLVLFPLVMKKGDDFGEGGEETVIYPAQVLVVNSKQRRKSVTSQRTDAMEVDDNRAFSLGTAGKSKMSLVSGIGGDSIYQV